MKISICITTFNEEQTIGQLLDSLFSQTKKADEIIIVDAASRDKTVEIINHYQKRFGNIKLLVEKCSRAKGRNLGVEIAKNEIIAMTDAGCVAQPDWLENLVIPFNTDRVGVSAGFYKMIPVILPSSTYFITGSEPFGSAMSVFLGVSPSKFDMNYLPSTRSVAFRKSVWSEIGGFPEDITGTAEDTVFNYKLLKNGVKIARVKNAVVEWGMPSSISEFGNKIFEYARGDVRSKIWIFPGKSLTSHNIKALSIVFRYLFAGAFFIYCFRVGTPLLLIWFFGFFAYLFWAFRKVLVEKGKVEIAIWGPVLQFVSDIAVISGFISGIIGR